jgi:hypothetical protein
MEDNFGIKKQLGAQRVEFWVHGLHERINYQINNYPKFILAGNPTRQQ